MTKDPMTLAEFVSTERTRQCLSLQHIANAAGCTKAHVSAIALGKTANPSVAMIRGLAVALGCEPEVVFRCAMASLPGLPE